MMHSLVLFSSPLLNVCCRRLETCTTSSWWASGERRRWRCLTMTWRTLWTARTRRTQVLRARAPSQHESVRMRASCSPDDKSQRALQTSDTCRNDIACLTSIWWMKNTKGHRAFLTDSRVEKYSCPHLAAKKKDLSLPPPPSQLP